MTRDNNYRLVGRTSVIGRVQAFVVDQTIKTLRRPSRFPVIIWGYIFPFIPSVVKRPSGFVITQIVKTIKNPSRVLVIILGYIRRQIPRKNVNFKWISFNIKWIPSIFAYTQHFAEAEVLLHENKPEQAWKLMSRALPYTKDTNRIFVAAACLIQGLGRKTEALKLLQRGNEIRRKQATILAVPFGRYHVLADIWPNQIGHVAVADYIIRQGILEGRSSDDVIFYVPPYNPPIPGKPPNPFFLEQWKPYCRFITDARDLPFPVEAIPALSVDYLGPSQKDGSTVYFWEVAAKVYRRWREEKREPVLSLSPEIQERGRAALERMGIPRDAWFVNLHVREVSSKPHHAGLHNSLNAQIVDYMPAIQEITRRGGWVIRLGDPSMSKLSPMPNVLDYCHSEIKADWMDIFLCANAKFLLGTSSGPAYIPQLYGVPAILTNWWPPAQRPWHHDDIFLPKLYRTRRSGRYLNLTQTLSEPYGYCNSLDYMENTHSVVVENNTHEDIHAATLEMLDRVAGTARYDSEDLTLRERAHSIYESSAAFGNAHLARDFIKSRKFLLD